MKSHLDVMPQRGDAPGLPARFCAERFLGGTVADQSFPSEETATLGTLMGHTNGFKNRNVHFSLPREWVLKFLFDYSSSGHKYVL